MKIILISPYFGKLPINLNYFLKSCEYNPTIDWIILTDDDNYKHFACPKNVTIIHVSFEWIKNRITNKFDFPIYIDEPYKLCDFRPAYGYIFEDYIKSYSHWGYCDLDIVFGNISNYVTKKLLSKYDKLFAVGHMSIYKNTQEVNKRFMASVTKYNEKFKIPITYKEILSIPLNCIFDEKSMLLDIHIIYNELKIPYYDNRDIIANIAYYTKDFTLFEGKIENISDIIFLWEKGHLFMKYIANGKLYTIEYMYVHIEKRMIPIENKIINDSFIITPNSYYSDFNELNKENVILYSQNNNQLYKHVGNYTETDFNKLLKKSWKLYQSQTK